jgi:hypothetical protein
MKKGRWAHELKQAVVVRPRAGRREMSAPSRAVVGIFIDAMLQY